MKPQIKTTMPAGRYYVGDPCYLFNQSWHKILEENEYFEKEEQKINGLKVACGGTAYGDGTYSDNKGRQYGVDAGLIGILPVELIALDGKLTEDEINTSNNMHIIEMNDTTEFEVEISDGVFQFGDIIINTKDEEDPEDEEDYSDDDEDNEDDGDDDLTGEPFVFDDKPTTKPAQDKPVAIVCGENGNVFVTLGICTKALKQAGQSDKVNELTEKVFAACSYNEALVIMGEYCELQ